MTDIAKQLDPGSIWVYNPVYAVILIGGFTATNYWSSTQPDNVNGGTSSAWFQSFSNGSQSYGTKDASLYVRAIRVSP